MDVKHLIEWWSGCSKDWADSGRMREAIESTLVTLRLLDGAGELPERPQVFSFHLGGAYVFLSDYDALRAHCTALSVDARRLDFLEADESKQLPSRKYYHALFRRNMPITRVAIDAALKDSHDK